MINRPRDNDPDKHRGLYSKFHVTRHDPDGKHKDCFYFVLDVDHDELALDALAAYANAAELKGYKPLASDLRGIIARQKIIQGGGNG